MMDTNRGIKKTLAGTVACSPYPCILFCFALFQRLQIPTKSKYVLIVFNVAHE